MVDTGDLKSPGSNTVPVRVRSPAPKRADPFGSALFVCPSRMRTGGSWVRLKEGKLAPPDWLSRSHTRSAAEV